MNRLQVTREERQVGIAPGADRREERGGDEQPRPTREELAAVAAVKRYNKGAKNPRVIKTIPLQSAGGYVCLVEFEDADNDEQHWPVVVRGWRADVYYDWEFAMVDATSRRWFFEFFSADVVLAILSFGILITVVIMFFKATNHEVPQVFAGALTTVLGFWFGKLAR
jgi:hypothetical protein